MSSLVLRSDLRSSQMAVLLGCAHLSPVAADRCDSAARAKRCGIREEGTLESLVPQVSKISQSKVSTRSYPSIRTPWFSPINTTMFQGPVRDEKAEEDPLLT